MRSEEAKALGLRWLAAGGLMLPGMLTHADHSASDRWAERHNHFTGLQPPGYGGWWPDFRDGATRGAALEWLREQAGEPTMHPHCHEWSDGETFWAMVCDHEIAPPLGDVTAPTEAELYPAALEALSEQG